MLKHFLVNAQGTIKAVSTDEERKHAELHGYTKHLTSVEVEEPAAAPEITDKHVKFLNERGYKVKTIEHVRKFIAKFTPEETAGFLEDAAKWEEPQEAGNA